jgi:hypothetical protein
VINYQDEGVKSKLQLKNLANPHAPMKSARTVN